MAAPPKGMSKEEIRAENERRKAHNESVLKGLADSQKKTGKAQECASCHAIPEGTMVEFEGKMYHTKCFVCADCKAKLSSFGATKVGVVDGIPYCGDCLRLAFVKSKKNQAGQDSPTKTPDDDENKTPSKSAVTNSKPTLVIKPPTSEPESASTPSKSTNSRFPIEGPLSFQISGKGAEGGPVKKLAIFTVTLRRIPDNVDNIEEADLFENSQPLKNPKKEDLAVYIESPQGTEIKTTIMGGSGAAYHIGLTPDVAGQFWVDFAWRGEWTYKPFMLPISAGSSNDDVPDYAYQRIHRKNAPQFSAISSPPPKSAEKPVAQSAEKPAPSTPRRLDDKNAPITPRRENPVTAKGPGIEKITDLEVGKFFIFAKDDSQLPPDDFDILIHDKNKKEVPTKISAVGNSRPPGIPESALMVSYGPVDHGDYLIIVKQKSKQRSIQGSPFVVNVTEEACGGELEVVGCAIVVSKNLADDIEQISVKCNDEDTQLYPIPNKPGGFSFEHYVEQGTQNVIDAQVEGKSLDGFPLNLDL